LKKSNGSIYPCDEKFPGVSITLSDIRPNTFIPHLAQKNTKTRYIKAVESEKNLWPGGLMPLNMKVFLNKDLIRYPEPPTGQSTNGLTTSAKSLIFQHQVVHEFGHVLGFAHEHYDPAAKEQLSSVCAEHINKWDKDGLVGGGGSDLYSTMGVYSRLSVMHYECASAYNDQLSNSNATQGALEAQVTLGPTDIATARKFYGIRHANDFPKAVWGVSGLDKINIADDATKSQVEFALGGKNSLDAEVNYKYYTQTRTMAEKIIINSIPTQLKGPAYAQYLSGNISPDGWPIFIAKNYNLTLNHQVEVRLEKATSRLNGVDYPGYKVKLKHLSNDYNSFVFMDVGKQKLKFEGSNIFQGWSAKYSSGITNCIHHSSPQFILYSYAASEVYPTLHSGYFEFFIPKGYGKFDQTTNEFYEEFSNPPIGKRWIETPEGKYRVNTNYDYAEFVLKLGKAGEDTFLKGVAIGDDTPLRLTLPYESSSMIPYFYSSQISNNTMKYIAGFTDGSGNRIESFSISQFEVPWYEYYTVNGGVLNNIPNLRWPVNNVTMYDAVLFSNKKSVLEGLDSVYSYDDAYYGVFRECVGFLNLKIDAKKSGYRLPTKNEWKRAYFGSSNNGYAFHWGNDASQAPNYSWYGLNSGSSPHNVGMLQPNSNSLYDMSGNVSEWTMTGPFTGWLFGGSYMHTSGGLSPNIVNYPANEDEAEILNGFRLVRQARILNPAIHILLLQ
jgi:Sulfatase-modifying factor enzyme 1/Astacin (Peptidase family M12A)